MCVRFRQKISELKTRIVQMSEEILKYKTNAFNLERIKHDPSAIKFYTGFPNYESLFSVFTYFEPKLYRIHYWNGQKSFEKNTGELKYQT